MQKRFSGVVVPMITPLNPDLTIDVVAVEKLMQLFANNNIHPLVLGTTGESSSIGEKESYRLVEAAVKAKAPNQCVYAGLVGNQVDALIERGNKYIALGADCVVATLPSYLMSLDAETKDSSSCFASLSIPTNSSRTSSSTASILTSIVKPGTVILILSMRRQQVETLQSFDLR